MHGVEGAVNATFTRSAIEGRGAVPGRLVCPSSLRDVGANGPPEHRITP